MTVQPSPSPAPPAITDEEMATTIERILVEMRTVIVGQQRPLERMVVEMAVEETPAGS